jgi:hypothetical protein
MADKPPELPDLDFQRNTNRNAARYAATHSIILSMPT